MSAEWLKIDARIKEISDTPEKEFGENDEEYDNLSEYEWCISTGIDHLENAVDRAVEFLPE